MTEVFILGGIAVFVLYRLYRTLGQDDGPPAGRNRQTSASSGGPGKLVSNTSRTMTVEPTARFTGPAAAILAEINAKDKSFNQKSFLDGAEQFYRMIVEAYQNGDREALEPWLDEDVKESWFAEITNRGEDYTPWTLRQFRFADIESASLTENMARIHVRFDATLSRNNSTQRVREVWTLMRDVTSDSPNWMLDDVEASV